ncbi:hypothetical protein Leryth_026559 [Lithospermum erythrorhizon]|nr:hypothetical protein Leryth_026559 [Lithospermum erythrorhizon]
MIGTRSKAKACFTRVQNLFLDLQCCLESYFALKFLSVGKAAKVIEGKLQRYPSLSLRLGAQASLLQVCFSERFS